MTKRKTVTKKTDHEKLQGILNSVQTEMLCDLASEQRTIWRAIIALAVALFLSTFMFGILLHDVASP